MQAQFTQFCWSEHLDKKNWDNLAKFLSGKAGIWNQSCLILKHFLLIIALNPHNNSLN